MKYLEHQILGRFKIFLRLSSVFLFFAFISSCLWSQNTAPKPPNIIVFLVDDMGWQDCSVPFYKEKTPFNARYHTPNMEKLAARGIKFTNAYANQNCTPSRVALLTGMNPMNHQVNSWTRLKDQSPEKDNDGVFKAPTWNLNGLSPVPNIPNSVYATTLPQLLHQQNYTTIHVGKAHFGAFGTEGSNPLNLGFDVNVGGSGAGQPASYQGLQNYGNQGKNTNLWAVSHLEKYWGKDVFLSEALTLEAISKVDSVQKQNKPFFLYMAHYAVHTPIQADSRFVQKYYDRGLDTIEAKYASLIEGMDKSLGNIMTYLDDQKLTDNTLIMFMSDNGGLTMALRGGEVNTHNKPLRSGKTSGYEGGLRVPMIVSWAGITKKQTVCSQNVIIEDFFPTILAAANIKNYKTVQKVDGLNLVPLFQGKKMDKNRILTWHYPHLHQTKVADVQPFSAIRKGKWKLMYFQKDQHFELYDTDNDIGETQNLATKNPKMVKQLGLLLSEKLRKSNSLMIIDMKTNMSVPFPDARLSDFEKK